MNFKSLSGGQKKTSNPAVSAYDFRQRPARQTAAVRDTAKLRIKDTNSNHSIH